MATNQNVEFVQLYAWWRTTQQTIYNETWQKVRLTWYPQQFEMQTDLLKKISAKCWKEPMEALGGVGFTHYAVSNHNFPRAVVKVGYVKKPCQFVKKLVFQYRSSSCISSICL